MQIHHETLRMERVFAVSPERLFAAYLNTREREIWSTPSETAEVKIEDADVRTGGSESTRCGAKGDLRYRTKVYYHMVEANEVITFSETLFENDTVLMAALISFDFQKVDSDRTTLVLTDQITSFVGPEGVKGHRIGFNQALDNLAARLAV